MRRVKTAFGKIWVLEDDSISFVLEHEGMWDAYILDWIKLLADDQKLAIDCGAHVGFYTLFMANMFKRVYAFEPQSRLYDVLVHNCDHYNYDNTLPLHYGLADVRVHMFVENPAKYVDSRGKINYGAAKLLEQCDQGESVLAVPLDSFSFRDNVDTVGLIKIDVQGMEHQVLEGAADTIELDHPSVIIETEEGQSRTDAFAFLIKHNYSIFGIVDDQEVDFVALNRAASNYADTRFRLLTLPNIDMKTIND